MKLTKRLQSANDYVQQFGGVTPLVVVDYQVVCYKLLNSTTEEDSDKVKLSRMIAYLMGLPSRQHLYGVWPTFTMVVVNDFKMDLEGQFDAKGNQLKGYWRHLYYPEYKGGRSVKPPLLHSIRDVGLQYILSPKKDITYLEFEGYEADDIAGAIVKAKRSAQLALQWNSYDNEEREQVKRIANRPVILVTVDKDWMQLVGDGVLWVDTGGYRPPVAYEAEAVEWAYKRHSWLIEHPYEIVELKVAEGDKSDNLPAGADIGLIDLSNPPKDFCLYEQHKEVFDSLLINQANSYNETDFNKALNYLISLGVDVVL